MAQGLVFDIKRYAINDGPGIRITIFSKGCPLACRWCHNPESISPNIQKMFAAAKCIGCGACVRICPYDACQLTAEGVVTDCAACQVCGQCAEACPSKATEMSGHYETVADLLHEIEKERVFFDQSGGGVTFSGGEPLMHPEFLIEMLDACGLQNIHRTVDTSGLAKTEIVLEVASRTELFLYDLKLMDSKKHREFTGVGNELILLNLQRLAETGVAIQIRVPLIGGVNIDPDNIETTAQFVANLAGEKKSVSLLPYHAIAAGKDLRLGQKRVLAGMAEPSAGDVEQVIQTFARHGLQATVGG